MCCRPTSCTSGSRAVKIAAREEGFVQIFGAALLLVILGTLT